MRDAESPTYLLYKIDASLDWDQRCSVRSPKLIETSTGHVFHREESVHTTVSFQNVCIKNTDDVRMAEPGEEKRLAEKRFDFRPSHAWGLEHLHRLSPQEAVTNTMNLGKRSFAKETLDLVRISKYLSLGEQRHVRLLPPLCYTKWAVEKRGLDYNAGRSPVNNRSKSLAEGNAWRLPQISLSRFAHQAGNNERAFL